MTLIKTNNNTLTSVQKDNYVIGGLQTHELKSPMKNISPCLTQAKGMGGGHTPIINGIRRLTPIECERLQGFPDDWTKTGKELGTISDSQRYKMCGNAVTVDVVEAVGKGILETVYGSTSTSR